MPQHIIKGLYSLCNLNGSTWAEEQLFRRYLLAVYKDSSLEKINPLIENGSIRVTRKNGSIYFSPAPYANGEAKIVENAYRILNAPHKTFKNEEINAAIDKIEKIKGLKLHEGQRNAVKVACNNNLIILTGGPGTGKTCTLNVMNDVITELMGGNIEILYTAPTGKASRRITESTGFPAYTLHKVLGLTQNNYEPKRIDKRYSVITVDEVSMLDVLCANALFKAVETGQKLILVGDTDQLPSVGAGAVLRDLIDSGCIPLAQLTKTFRQAGDSILFDNIQRVKRGNPSLKGGEDFRIAIPKNDIKSRDILLYQYMHNAYTYGMENVMVLTPMKKGAMGSDKLNQMIQERNTNSEKIILDDKLFKKGDIVMQQINTETVANGDIGIIEKIDKYGVIVKYIDCECAYSKINIDQIGLSYAMTIHKSQGSEAPSVITCMLPEHEKMSQRNLLYTGITRAKSVCDLICSPEAIKKAVEINSTELRTTMLSDFLRNYR